MNTRAPRDRPTVATVIRVTRPADGGAELEVELVRQPSIYLDQDSLTDIARTPARRERFLNIWKRKGELMLSFANAIDLAGPQGDHFLEIGDAQPISPAWSI